MSGLAPQTPKDFLTTARVKLTPGVYLLGCNHRQITFYSQQTRAVNLVHSLLHTNKLTEGQSVAVVGAGVAGVTAAAFAAEHGCKVSIYEKEDDALTLQRDCEQRWIHPHVYDWPEPESLNDATDLPVLNWTAGTAKQVVGQIRAGWEKILERHAQRIAFHGRTRIGSEGSPQAARFLSHLAQSHAVVLLAVGFGTEPERFGTPPYWVDADLRDISADAWLISGFGDGALADLMRICIRDFDHRWLKDLVEPIPLDGPTARALLTKEAEALRGLARLDEFYEREVPNAAVLRLLRPRVETSKRVTLHGQPGSLLYGATSAIINRFVTAHIHQLYREAHGTDIDRYFRVVTQPWHGPPTQIGSSRYRVEFPREPPFEGALVIRHGPESLLKRDFPDVWDDTESDRVHLRTLPQQLDTSRLPIVATGPLWEVERRTLDTSKWWCLVLTREPELDTVMKWALSKLETRLTGWFPDVLPAGSEALELAIKPVTVSVSTALRDAGSYRTIVRALCRADVVVADVTDFDPGMMVLLGIRAAARRGVTIVTTATRPPLSEYNTKIPFNLREISLLDHLDQEGYATDPKGAQFAELIARGMTNYRVNPNYQDLPGYSHVRLPRVDWAESDVLVLCPFSAASERRYQQLKGDLKQLTKQRATCRRVIDDESPWLNSQRLFGAIRHANYCLVDWTEWRHNVFFELGVRLAVHPKGAICVIDERRPEPPLPSHADSATLLKALFRPEPFSNLRGAWRDYDQMRADESYWGGTYRTVSEAVQPEQTFFLPVHNVLLSSVRETVGAEPGNVDTQELYGGTNETVLQQYQKAARERLLAAWFYLENRFNPSTFTDDDLKDAAKARLAVEYEAVASDLLGYLKTKEFQLLRRDVTEKQRVMKKRLGGTIT